MFVCVCVCVCVCVNSLSSKQHGNVPVNDLIV